MLNTGSAAPTTESSVQPATAHYVIPPKESESASVAEAKDILRNERQATPKQVLALTKTLKNENRFSYARRLLWRVRDHESLSNDHELCDKVFQQLALCTYKDEELPVDDRLDCALSILRKIRDFETTTNQETLGLTAAIYKRKWEVDNQRQHLELSLTYYLKGYAQGPSKDQGYTGINAAFVLDRLASLEEKGAAGRTNEATDAADDRRKLAQQIRQDIVDQVGPLIRDPDRAPEDEQWWYYATVAEAHFGLGNYDEAVKCIKDGHAAVKQINEWELETCARQLAAIARLQLGEEFDEERLKSTPAWSALEDAFSADAVPRTAFAGKIGLALSGGGFRASLYHLGVLARLAELDVLRNVEVLSCVSGGSIVGAYYYLKVRHLLEHKLDSEISRNDYIRIVHEMIDEFVAGVQKNIRTRVAANPLKNFHMFWSKDYSRTARAAELYEEHLYALVNDGHENGERWLNDLTIAPLIDKTTMERKTNFSPRYQNWRRNAKVPILVLNAATLNTGHTWQFTATWMGEAPGAIDSEIDGNDRLRRMYYPDAPAQYKKVRLGQAVGASAAVPGVFEPLTFDNLYPARIVRLVDGGVTDNQGIATLLEQDCKVVLVSDASGQMESQPAASRGLIGTLLRTNNIFQARIRQAQYHDLKGRRRSDLLRGFMFVHLKGDLEVDPVNWIGCEDPYDPDDDMRSALRRDPAEYKENQTRYGIAKDIQERLSALRTDLDSFSEAEAYALMTSAYRMTEYQFNKKCVEGFVAPKQSERWKFLEIEDCMKGSGKGYEYLKNLLTAGSSLAFKVWKIDPILKNLARIVAVLLVVGVIAAFYFWWSTPLPEPLAQRGTGLLNSLAVRLQQLTPEKIATALFWIVGFYLLARVLTWLFGAFVSENTIMLVRWKDTLQRIAIATAVSTAGFLVAMIHLYIFDKRFLSLSSLKTVKKKNA